MKFVIKIPHRLRAFFAVILIMGSIVSPLKANGLTIYAASSLSKSVGEIIKEYEKMTGTEITHSFAASSVLARQIINGAPADIYISANTAWMDEIDRYGLLLRPSRRVVASNRLAFIASKFETTPRLSEGTIPRDYPFLQIIGDKRIALADPGHVPAGIYARQSLEDAGVWDELQPHLIPMPNVRAALALVERGEVSFGFVYITDLSFSSKVRLLGVMSAASHDYIHYTAGIVSRRNDPQIEAFMAFLTSTKAAGIFISNGFLRPKESLIQ